MRCGAGRSAEREGREASRRYTRDSTLFTGEERMALLLTRDDLRPLLDDRDSMDDAFERIDIGFREHEEGTAPRVPTVELPLTGPQRTIRLNVGASPTFGASIRTYPSLVRTNPDSHVNLLFAPDNGQLQAIISGDDLNMLRTAIPVGSAARRLARSSARVLAMVGSGRQARGQARTITAGVPSLERVVVYSPTEAHRVAYAEEMAAALGILVEAVPTCREAVEQADVISLVASTHEPVLEADWVRPGALALSINSAQIPPELVTRSRVVLGYRGDRLGPPYSAMIEHGSWSMDQAATYGEIVMGTRPGRETDVDVILADMLGMSVWDVALLSWAYQWAIDQELGTEFHLSD